ncbi:MAG TPA: NAD(P)-dependent oxidoreductase [Candidatus Limnocylindrales bacterium]|nr:NAD(P)-dependent oxidoreductase [Candidatus Limnocylindrales bacterium]
MTKKVLITGGTGFLGVHLARKFLKEKYVVTLFDLAELDAEDLIGKVKVVLGDIRDSKIINKALIGQDYIVHAAAALPIQVDKKVIFSVNIDGTRNILSSALKNKIKRLVFISSTAVYGVPKHLPETETSPLDPIGHYGISKIEGEKLCMEYQKKGLQVNIIRPKTFLGTERLGVFELWFEAIYTDKRVFILGDGNNKYQLLAVTDIADAIEKALTTRVNGEIFNIGAEKFGTWKSDLGYVIKQTKSKSKITGLPTLPSQFILQALEVLRLSPIAAWHYKTMPVDSYVSVEKAKKLLHWQPKKSNQDLFLESYLWYKQNRKSVHGKIGNTHRVGWNFKILNLISRF